MQKVVHFEIPVDDIERAKKFYSSIFEWNLQDWPTPEGTPYVGVRTVNVNEETHLPTEPGAINGGIIQRSKIAPSPILAIQVPSIDETVKKVEAAGGKVTRPKEDIGGGFYAYVTDLEGNTIGLFEEPTK